MSNSFGLAQMDNPYKSYIKRSLGKLYVNVLDPFSGEVSGVILFGNPGKPTPECVLEVWSEKEDKYLHRANKKHFDSGELVEYFPKEEKISEEVRLNSLSDEELKNILNDRFYSLKNYAEKVTSVAPLLALLRLAEESEKTEKITNFIKDKIAALQEKEFNPEQEKQYLGEQNE